VTGLHQGLPRTLLLSLSLVALAACAGGPDPEASGMSHMYVHYARVGEIHSAVVDGSIDDTRSPARWLATHRAEEFPAGGQEALEAMRNEARIIAAEDDLAGLGRAVARMGNACGSCHSALGSGPNITVVEPPPMSSVPSESMKRHAWASDRLWEGLVGPSAAAWAAGAGALGSSPMDFGTNDPANRLAMRVQGLSEKAAAASTPRDRAAVYGDLLETCSLCHRTLQMRMR
jgi:cytochrome c556